MKRQHFDISLNGSVVATTFAWNAAIRAIERLVRERAREVAGCSTTYAQANAAYTLVESHTEGPDKWHFTRGHRTWRSVHETLRYDIELRACLCCVGATVDATPKQRVRE